MNLIKSVSKCLSPIIRVLFIAGLMTAATQSHAVTVLEAGDEVYSRVNIIPHIEIMEDVNKNLSIKDVSSSLYNDKFQPYNDNRIRLYDSQLKTYWFRFTVRNNSTEHKRFWLGLDNIHLDAVTLFTPTRNGFKINSVGDQIVNPEWKYTERYNNFSIDMSPIETKTYYLRVESLSSTSIIFFTPTLSSDHAHIINSGSENVMTGIMYGLIFALFIYTLNIFLTIREKSYFYYLLLLCAATIEIAATQGTIKVVFNGYNEIVNSAITFSYLAVNIASAYFVCHFLRLPQANPKLHMLGIYTALASVPVFVLFSLFIPDLMSQSVVFSIVASTIFLTVCSAKRLLDGYKPALFILIGFGLYYLGISYIAAINEPLTPSLTRTNVMSLALVLQLLAFTCGLVSRIDGLNKQLSTEVGNRKQREDQLIYAQSLARYGDWHWNLSQDRAVLSPSAQEILPDCIEKHESDFSSIFAHMPETDRHELLNMLEMAKNQKCSTEVEVRIVNNNDVHHYLVRASYQSERNKPAFLIGTVHDVTIEKRHEEQLKRLGHYDNLTGLTNRILFQERLQHAINKASRAPQNHALLFIDLDQFKNINDSLGHEVGDKLLVEVAARLKEQTRIEDTVCRLGGDEFAILIEDTPAPHAAAAIAEHIINCLAKPIEIDDYKLIVTPSIGIAMYPDNAKTMSDLIKKADTAMYHAKNQGRNNFQFYTNQLNDQITRKMDLESELRSAIANNELFVNFQPKVELKTGTIVGAESLLRWNSEKFGVVSPAEFIPVAEDTGLIWPIGEYVLRESCEQAKIWLSRYSNFGSIAVNISGHQFNQSNLYLTVKNILEETGLPAKHLELEITEHVIIGNAEDAMHTMRELKKLGVKLSLDDFGTGYSSLKYLKRFPVDCLKIDRSFVKEIVSNGTDRRIATNIVNLAHELKLKVVAEGVETVEQLALIEEMKCDELQGFIFSPAVSSADMSDMLENDDNLSYHVPEIERFDQLDLITP